MPLAVCSRRTVATYLPRAVLGYIRRHEEYEMNKLVNRTMRKVRQVTTVCFSCHHHQRCLSSQMLRDLIYSASPNFTDIIGVIWRNMARHKAERDR